MNFKALGTTLIVRIEKKVAKEPTKVGNIIVTQQQPEDNYDNATVVSIGKDVSIDVNPESKVLIFTYAGKAIPSSDGYLYKTIREDEMIAAIEGE